MASSRRFPILIAIIYPATGRLIVTALAARNANMDELTNSQLENLLQNSSIICMTFTDSVTKESCLKHGGSTCGRAKTWLTRK
jgi:hypothetical protein